MFVDLTGEHCIVIGGGKVAYRKVRALLDFDAKITVISLQVCEEMVQLELEHKITIRRKSYEGEDLKEAFLVISATNQKEVNLSVSKECKKRKIPVNVVDVQQECSFIFPAYIKKGPITVGITSSGTSPVISQRIKKKVIEVLPDYYPILSETLGTLREEMKERIKTEKQRKAIYEQLIAIGEQKEGNINRDDVESVLSKERKVEMEKVIRIGTRKSKLALAQTDFIIQCLKEVDPSLRIEKVLMNTKGDKILDKSLQSFGGKGAFITELEEAMQRKEVDLVVHSAKDMPMELGEGLAVLAHSKREDPRDVLVIKKGANLKNILEHGVIGTCSLRRKLFLLKNYPVMVKNLRGNVQTRLAKLESGEYDGIVLAAAGLNRLNLLDSKEFEYHYFSTEEFVPAGGQGIITVEGRRDSELLPILEKINDQRSEYCLQVERAVLRGLNAGCNEPIGVYSFIDMEKVESESNQAEARLQMKVNENLELRIERQIERQIETVEDEIKSEKNETEKEEIESEKTEIEKEENFQLENQTIHLHIVYEHREKVYEKIGSTIVSNRFSLAEQLVKEIQNEVENER